MGAGRPRVGVLGGTFNPVHYGHLRSAEEVRRALALDEVRFVPSASPPHKPEGEIAPAADRLEMVRVALEKYPALVCDPVEVERGGVSYTLDTLREMAGRVPEGAGLFFIIGADAFAELREWRRPQEVLGAANFAVTLRGSQNSPENLAALLRLIREVEPGYRAEEGAAREARFEARGRVVRFVPIPEVDVSATRIRRRVKEAAPIRRLLPREVELYIIRRRLYGHPGVVS